MHVIFVSGACMQTTQIPESGTAALRHPTTPAPTENSSDKQWNNFHIIRRNGVVVGFEPGKIAIAMTKAFLAVNGGQGAASARVRELVETLTAQVVNALVRNRRSEEHTSELQSLMRISYAVFC